MNLFNARSELLKLFAPHIAHRRTRGNWPGRTIAGQCFHLRINEDMSAACSWASDIAGATAVLNPPAVASQDLENANG